MLDSVNLGRKLPKKEYKAIVAPLKAKLAGLQHEVKAEGLTVLVLLEGWSAAGKGSLLGDVLLALDPRNFKTKSTLPPTEEEQRRPFLQRHWDSLPPAGWFRFYNRSWYPEASVSRLEEGISKNEAVRRTDAINVFERQLSDDGVLIIKFFLHVSKKEQKRRLKALSAKKSTAWRATKQDYRQNKKYKKYYAVFDEMLEATHTEAAPWHIVPCHNKRAALASIYETLVAGVEDALETRRAAAANTRARAGRKPLLYAGDFTLRRTPLLGEAETLREMSREEYNVKLARLQSKLGTLHNKIYRAKIPLIVAYEGWDAAGKGGNIKRLAAALDPQGYEVIPIASPTPPEKARQYLWRFWEHLPKEGHVAIFDRTWYGRVMVERIEGFAGDREWRRAYREINEFEAQLAQWGAVVLKFWLQISKDEQLRRFESRQNTPEKQWKITEEDWRNREKWNEYETAANDMLRLTSTSFAPWTIVESDNKLYARIKVLKTVIKALEERL